MTIHRPGNLENLKAAAAARTAATATRADAGLREMLRTGQPITFRGLARHAGVSLDFLYSSTALRQRVQQLRGQQRIQPGGASGGLAGAGDDAGAADGARSGCAGVSAAGAGVAGAVALGMVARFGFQRGGDDFQRGGFSRAALQPDVVFAHRSAGAGGEGLLADLDQLQCPLVLLPQFGQEGCVGDELVAGQAGVPAVAALPGRQRAVAVGQVRDRKSVV